MPDFANTFVFGGTPIHVRLDDDILDNAVSAVRVARADLRRSWCRQGYPRYMDMLTRPAHVIHAELSRLPSTLGVQRGDVLKLADGTTCKVCRYNWHERQFVCTTGTRTVFVREDRLLGDVQHYVDGKLQCHGFGQLF